MPNTYSQITIHLVFAVKGSSSHIHDSFREKIHKYITGIVTNQRQKLLAVNFSSQPYSHFNWSITFDMSFGSSSRNKIRIIKIY